MQYKHNKELVPFAKELRKKMTKEERHLWYDFLRGYPVRFLRQKVIGKFIVDFYCADGEAEAIEYDSERTAFLKNYGLTVLRIPNNEIRYHFQEVCAYIDSTVQQSLSQNDF